MSTCNKTSLYKFMGPKRVDFFSKPLVRFTPLTELNDPFEGRIVFDRLVSHPTKFKEKGEAIIARICDARKLPQEQREMFLRTFRLDPEHVHEAMNKYILPWLPEGMLATYIKKGLGVFSLSAAPNHELMWSHYGRDHKGFVIGFNPEHPFFDPIARSKDFSVFGFKPVSYSLERPTLSWLEAEEGIAPLYLSLFVKSPAWKYEQEWRVIISGADNLNQHKITGLVDMPIEAITEVRVGFSSDFELEDKARIFCRKHKIPLKRAVLHAKNWELEFKDI